MVGAETGVLVTNIHVAICVVNLADLTLLFGFIATAAIGIEKRNHHPEWFNVYNRVRVDLTTHESGGITQKDADLAEALETIAKKLT